MYSFDISVFFICLHRCFHHMAWKLFSCRRKGLLSLNDQIWLRAFTRTCGHITWCPGHQIMSWVFFVMAASLILSFMRLPGCKGNIFKGSNTVAIVTFFFFSFFFFDYQFPNNYIKTSTDVCNAPCNTLCLQQFSETCLI